MPYCHKTQINNVHMSYWTTPYCHKTQINNVHMSYTGPCLTVIKLK